MKNKIIFPIFALASVGILASCGGSSDSSSTKSLSSSDIDYIITDYGDDKAAIVKGVKITDSQKKEITEITIPDTIEGYPVYSINKGAFAGFSNLKSISLPFIGKLDSRKWDEDTNAGEELFGYVFGDKDYEGATSTAQYYFDYDTYSYSTFNYYIPDSLTSVKITNCDTIPSGAFSCCYSLRDISFSEKCAPTYSDVASFYDCEQLTSVKLPASLREIGRYSFAYCYSLPTIELPSQLDSIDDYAFEYCLGLDYVVIPAKVSYIGDYAFCDCNDYDNSLRSNYINDYPTLMFESSNTDWLTNGDDFAGPYNETNNVKEGIEIVDLLRKPSYGKIAHSSQTYPIAIGFTGKWGTTEDGFRYAICELQGQSFAAIMRYNPTENSNDSNLRIPNNIIAADGNTYKVREIAPSALQGIKNVDEVIVPENVTYIGSYAFRDGQVGSITFEGTKSASYNLTIADGAFSRLNVGKLSVSHGMKTIPSGMFARADIEEFVIPSDVTKIESEAFYASNIKKISFDKSSTIEVIGEGSFAYCTGLEEIVIPKTVKRIESGAFSRCYNLKKVTFEAGTEDNPNQLVEICDGAFYCCESLTKVDLTTCPNLRLIGEAAFAYCDALTGVDISKCSNLSTISCGAFFGSKLVSIVIPKSVNKIKDFAFGKSAITTVTFETGGSSLDIYQGAFAHTKIESITLPKHVTLIGNNCFRYCKNLSSVTFEDEKFSQLHVIGNQAFAGCNKLTTLRLPDSMADDGSYLGSGLFDLRNLDDDGTQIKEITPVTVILPYDGDDATERYEGCRKLHLDWGWNGDSSPEALYYTGKMSIYNDGFSGTYYSPSYEDITDNPYPPIYYETSHSYSVFSNVELCCGGNIHKPVEFLRLLSGLYFEESQITCKFGASHSMEKYQKILPGYLTVTFR